MINSIKKINSTEELDVSCWVKTRNSLTGKSTFLLWEGSVYAFVPNEKKKHLFKIVGMSVSRCLKNEDDSWDFTSRELTYYLDPQTGKIMHQWHNPWTGETVPVVHVANHQVQGLFKGNFPAQVNGETTTFIFDLFSDYPNPLGGDGKFSDYSPQATYQATELFKLTVPTAELHDCNLAEVSQVILSWDRIGPWLPWMKMGNKPGQLIYSAHGCKVSGFNELPEWLQAEINHRVPLYKDAPPQKLDAENITSWKYFKQHFADYLAGARFPLSTI